MELMYKSTRGRGELITASEAIIKGIADDKGLFVPVEIPKLDLSLKEMKEFDYCKLTKFILKKFLMDFSESEIEDCVKKAFEKNFESKEVVKLSKVSDEFFLELYHGPTLAFKDVALSLLPHLLKTAMKKHNIKKEIVILTATSGDTGKAALEGFKDLEQIKIIVFYPDEGVSQIQKMQMITQDGNNTSVVAINGNFDDAQNGVKMIFNDEQYKEFLAHNNYILSSANSINIGRLIPQIVYYFYSYLQLLVKNEIDNGDLINVVVPTGNFGNILAGFFAKQMGLPINRLICASNENNVLYDFINSGVYDGCRELKKTISPSMDILISSNLERLNYYLSNENEERIKELMGKLSSDCKYEIDQKMKDGLKLFHAGFATELDTIKSIKEIFDKFNYCVDTHTAVAWYVYNKYKKETGDATKTVIVSTASPFKFAKVVCQGLGLDVKGKDDFEAMDEIAKLKLLKIPSSIHNLRNKEVRHKEVCDKESMKDYINQFLNI